MKNLITCAFAFREGYQTSKQISKTAGAETTDMYLKNILVSLYSAKKSNPDDDVLLCTNCDIPDKWKRIFESKNIPVRKIEFDSFVIPQKFPWALAFFKMCVLNTLVNEGAYERFLLLDADTYTVLPYEDLWKESDTGVLLYPLGHSFFHHDRQIIKNDFYSLYPDLQDVPVVHYGGEFVAGNIKHLKPYMDVCREIFDKLSEKGFSMEERIGDEDIWSAAATLSFGKIRIVTATPYVFRFWTEDFYLISTVTVSNPVCIWHLPAEKETGIIRLYNYVMKNDCFPSVNKASKYLGITKAQRPFNIYTFANKFNRKIKKWFHK